MRKEPWSLLSCEFSCNRLTTHATATSAWRILPNVALARIHLKLFIQTFFLPLPKYHTAPSCQFQLPRRVISHLQETAASQIARKILKIQITDAVEERRSYFPNQKDINDLIRDLALTKSNAELLTSRLKQRNLMYESVQVTDQR